MNLEPGGTLKALAVVAAIIALAIQFGLAGPAAHGSAVHSSTTASATVDTRP